MTLDMRVKVCTVCGAHLGQPHDFTQSHACAGWRHVHVVQRRHADNVAAALSDVCDNTLTVRDARVVADRYWSEAA